MNETNDQPECQPQFTPESRAGEVESAAEPTVLFVSDAHFHLAPDAGESRRVARFLDLLTYAQGADELVLLGDIFDFWFDYPHFRLNGYDALLTALDQVRESGTTIHFVGGNHDIWAAAYFKRRYGCPDLGAAAVMQFGSRRVLLDHGDGLLKFDWAYSAFRALVRTRAGIVLAKSLHPEILFAVSTWLSGHSREATRDEASELERLGRKWFDRQRNPVWNLMVMGHVHHGFLFERDSRQMAALAGWFDPLSFGLLKGGRFALYDFDRDEVPRL